MKKLIVATMMLCASTAQAVDWSPVFKGWAGDCLYFEHPVAKAVFEVSSDYVPSGDYGAEQTHTVLSLEGQMGDYSTVPMPYRQDLLPATHLRHDFDGQEGVYIPLQNAKFYQLDLQGIEFYDSPYDWYSALNFGKYSKAKEQQLKKIIRPLQKKSIPFPVSIFKTEHNELILLCDIVTSG